MDQFHVEVESAKTGSPVVWMGTGFDVEMLPPSGTTLIGV
jgi:hypothetical protein